MPLEYIVHTLSNEPYCHTPTELLDMHLNELALIWTKVGPKKELSRQEVEVLKKKIRKRQIELGVIKGDRGTR